MYPRFFAVLIGNIFFLKLLHASLICKIHYYYQFIVVFALIAYHPLWACCFSSCFIIYLDLKFKTVQTKMSVLSPLQSSYTCLLVYKPTLSSPPYASHCPSVSTFVLSYFKFYSSLYSRTFQLLC